MANFGRESMRLYRKSAKKRGQHCTKISLMFASLKRTLLSVSRMARGAETNTRVIRAQIPMLQLAHTRFLVTNNTTVKRIKLARQNALKQKMASS